MHNRILIKYKSIELKICQNKSTFMIGNVKIMTFYQATMTIEYLKCRADLNFEVNFGVNGAIGIVVKWWDLIVFGKHSNLVSNNSFEL